MSDLELDRKARRILRENDRDGYTVPTARLYPHQWNWDSAFAALGLATFDRKRAWLELFRLFEGQWPDGMVPHIIFRSNDPSYFPGPNVWGTAMQPPTSGYSQPPVAATIVAKLVASGDEADREYAHRLYPALICWHRWFHTMRDPDDRGIIGVPHPWEAGRDNCPDWDHALEAVNIAPGLGPYQRRDMDHVSPDQRPSSDQYDRYLTLVKYGRDCGWDQLKIARQGPFFVADPGICFILLKADRDLLTLAAEFGSKAECDEILGWIDRAEHGADWLWHDAIGAFLAWDMRSGKFAPALSSASFLAFYAGAGTKAQQSRLLEHAERIAADARFAMPSWDPAHPAFDHKRYWRGPVWLILNYMISEGLRTIGATALAARVESDTLALIRQSGFWEYFSPRTGEGLGGKDFSWSAAIWLALRHPLLAADPA